MGNILREVRQGDGGDKQKMVKTINIENETLDQRSLRIAKAVLRKPDAIVKRLGGMQKPEARRIILKLTGKKAKK